METNEGMVFEKSSCTTLMKSSCTTLMKIPSLNRSVTGSLNDDRSFSIDPFQKLCLLQRISSSETFENSSLQGSTVREPNQTGLLSPRTDWFWSADPCSIPRTTLN